MESYKQEEIWEEKKEDYEMVMEVDDDGTLEEFDRNNIDEGDAECKNCLKIDHFYDSQDKNYYRGVATGLYFCDDCIEKLNEMRYFYQLELKGILQENIPRITKIYPKYKTYNLQNIRAQEDILKVFEIFLEGEEITEAA